MFEPTCTCIAPSTINSYCAVHMPATKAPTFDTGAGAGAAPVYGSVTLSACPRCGAMVSGLCFFCGERDARQAALRDVAKRAREDERAKMLDELRAAAREEAAVLVKEATRALDGARANERAKAETEIVDHLLIPVHLDPQKGACSWAVRDVVSELRKAIESGAYRRKGSV